MRVHGLVVVALVVTATPSAALKTAGFAMECHGAAATIVGDPAGQSVLRGTPGADVIVTQGAFEVRAGNGDDLICVTGGDDAETGNVYAGAGSDEVWVDTTDKSNSVWVELGLGADTLHGSVGGETVWAGVASTDTRDGPEDNDDADTDVISTGGSMDTVILGDPRNALSDVVDTGGGDDEVILAATAMTPEARLDLGAGLDNLDFYWPTDTMGAWVFDNRAGVGTLDGAPRLQWSSAEVFDLPEPGANAVSFLGTDADEMVWAPSYADIDLAGGDDYFSTVESWTALNSTEAGRVHGGPGRDYFNINGGPYGAASVDLVTGHVRFADHQWFIPAEIDSFEKVRVAGGDPITVRGDANNNRIEVGGCAAEVYAGGGDDRVIAFEMSRCGASSRGVLRGGAGADLLVGGPADDRLLGGPGPDLINGGPGHDRANGGPGNDTCRAEDRVSCRAPKPAA